MANEKEVKQLESLIESMKSASDALVKPYPSGSIALKYMATDVETMVADLKGREGLGGEAQKRQVYRSSEGLPGITRPFTTEEMNDAQAKIFGLGAANAAHQAAMREIGGT